MAVMSNPRGSAGRASFVPFDTHPWKTNLESYAALLDGKLKPAHSRCLECELARQKVRLHELRIENWGDEKGEDLRQACVRIVERRLKVLKERCENPDDDGLYGLYSSHEATTFAPRPRGSDSNE